MIYLVFRDKNENIFFHVYLEIGDKHDMSIRTHIWTYNSNIRGKILLNF